MDDLAIKVSNVTKTFRLFHEKRNTVYETVSGFFNKKKYFETLLVLDNISFEVKKGEMFGIIGRNGIGKTTLLRLISGIYKPNSGKKIYYMERARIRFATKNFDFSYLLVFYFYFFFETLFIFLRDLKNLNFFRSKIRFRAINWNFVNLGKIISRRRLDISYLKQNGHTRSYNRHLPLRNIKIS